MKHAFIIGLLSLIFCLPAGAYEQYINPVEGEFPILAWYSIRPDSALTHERYQELADCGFNVSFSHFATTDEIAKALKACKGTGVKLMLTTWDMEVEDKTARIVNQFKDDPMVGGWFLRDEPTTHGFAELKKFKDRITACDTKHQLYLNLLPNYVDVNHLGTKTYREYVERFTQEVDLGLISFDNYPVVKYEGQIILRDVFYANLEDVMSVSKQTGEPFWAFALSTAHICYPVATREMLRLQIFSNLAYGAQGIQYFTYWNPGNLGTWNFNTAPISLDGRRTHVWYLVRDLNREVKQLTPYFLGAKVVDVAHTGEKIPTGTHQLTTLPAAFQSITASGQGVLVSHLKNKGKEYLMILNRDINKTQTVTVAKNQTIKRIQGDIITKDKSKTQQHTLAPGDYLLYEF